ncbi:MAG: 50S ribosomal protein L9 [Flavobacteriales bacterium]|nr:50S ribosomal protein L9 [Flavobacteriales bacterium]MCB9448842.1 50S ribosomal protein L9 [Flavobacteriales bacterium]
MEIILKQYVKGLGEKNDIVTVRDGYGRNFLIPQGLGVIANSTNKKVLAENMKQSSFKETKIRKEAEDLAGLLKDKVFKIGAKVGESGKIFGSVTALQIADAIKEAGHTVDRKFITIKEEPIKELGAYSADVKLYKDIHATVQFEVVSE